MTRKGCEFPQAMIVTVQQGLQTYHQRCAGLDFCTVATKDGFPVAVYPDNAIPAKLPVMAGTMLALGDSIGQSSILEECENIAIEGRNGNIIILSIAHQNFELVLLASARKSTSLGMLLTLGRDCAASISKQLRYVQSSKESQAVEELDLRAR
jgi:predicted regulator of Ras-like GTPase activity (Roadblock/LC7/MglB family)